mgnify:CR=1 FL=1
MNKKIIRISDIREDLYDANLDTEYREALAHAMIQLEYISGTPLNLYLGTEKEKKEKPNDSYYMLIDSKCPGIIVECGFLSNNKEAANLVDEKYQKEISKILCRGIVKYFDKK